MALPVRFPEANLVLIGKPGSDVVDLPAYQGGDTAGRRWLIACWELSPQERREVMLTGKVWVQVAGTTQPPMAVCGLDPFVRPDLITDPDAEPECDR